LVKGHLGRPASSGEWHTRTAGGRLRYHGDFDWAGLAIGNFVMREFGAEPWRFKTTDYSIDNS
jgi:hypothetical protein